MRRTKGGYTLKQHAYAMRMLAPSDAKSKAQMAREVGYSPSVALSVSDKIEKTEGFSNAIAALAAESGNVALKLMHKLKHQDIGDMSFEVAVDQLTKIAAVFEKFTPKQSKGDDKPNGLRDIILREVTPVESRTVEEADAEKLDI